MFLLHSKRSILGVIGNREVSVHQSVRVIPQEVEDLEGGEMKESSTITRSPVVSFTVWL